MMVALSNFLGGILLFMGGEKRQLRPSLPAFIQLAPFLNNMSNSSN